MRNIFPTYYEPNDEEYNDIWKNAIFVFDTNVLLNLYRYTKSTRKELLQILENLKDKVWIPHQVGLEYHSNRIAVILEQTDAFDQIVKSLNESSQSITSELHDNFKQFKKRHPSINLDSIIQEITNSFNSLTRTLQKEKEEHPNLLKDDTILETITELFTDKIGPKYDQLTLDTIFSEGEKRYKNKVPPGYKDKKEGAVKRYEDLVIKSEYGDLIVWKQMLEKAKKDNVSIIFVTDDVKEDWWNKVRGKTIGPRLELINEFAFETKQKFIMYTTKSFMEYASDFLKEELRANSKSLEKAIKEVEKLGEANKSEGILSRTFEDFFKFDPLQKFSDMEIGYDRDKLKDFKLASLEKNLKRYKNIGKTIKKNIKFEVIEQVYEDLLEHVRDEKFAPTYLTSVIRQEIWKNRDLQRNYYNEDKSTFDNLDDLVMEIIEIMLNRGLVEKLYADDQMFFVLVQD